MFKKNLKRCLAVLLTVMMLVSSLPTGVFATELESTVTETEHDHEHAHALAVVLGNNTLVVHEVSRGIGLEQVVTTRD